MADRLEVQFSTIVQTRDATLVTVRLYRLGDPVLAGDGSVTYPRAGLQTLRETIGPVQPWARFVEIYTQRAIEANAQAGWNLAEVVCTL